MTLHEIRKAGQFDVAALLTTVTEGYDRISMHGVRVALLEAQARAVEVPLHKIPIPQACTNDIYEARMRETLEHFKALGIARVAFGDLFLADIREYREKNLARIDMQGVWPIWLRDTRKMAAEFIDLGFKAVLCCVDTKKLDASFAGREFTRDLLRDFPESVDPCGENGEFHSFVFDGPIFREPVNVTRGEVVTRGQFAYCDLV